MTGDRHYIVPAAALPAVTAQGTYTTSAAAVVRSIQRTKYLANAETVAGTLGGAASNSALALKLVTRPLAAQTVSGTLTVVMSAFEGNATDNINNYTVMAWVMKPDGTSRSTLLAQTTAANTVELGTTAAGVLFTGASGATLSSQTLTAGDCIVVEIGFKESATGTTPAWNVVIGGPGTDHTTTNGDTTGTVGWVEFSGTLTYQTLPDPLTVWKADYAAMGSGLATIVMVGASSGEGAGATAITNRYAAKMAANLRTAAGVAAGGVGFTPSYFSTGMSAFHTANGSSFAWMDATTGAGTTEPQETWSGIGWRITDGINASGDGFTMTVHGTSIDVVYDTESTSGHITVSIDGGTATNINTVGGATEVLASTHITMGSSGSHTVAVRWASGGESAVTGVIVYDGDETTGLRMIDACQFGITAGLWLTTPDGPPGPNSGGAYAGTLDYINGLNPSLVIIDLGGNEFLNGTDLPAAYEKNLLEIIGDFQSRSNSPSILILGHFPYDASMGDGPDPWSSFRDAMADAAPAVNAAFYDLSTVMPVAGASGNPTQSGLYVSTDYIHPTDLGHSTIAGFVSTFLEPAPTSLTTAGFFASIG